MSELSEDSKFNVSIKTLVGIGSLLLTLAGMYYTLKSDIEIAKQLPEPPVSRTEYDLKDQLIRETIISTEEKVNANSEKLDKIDEKLYEIIKK
jgi:hypothetical protein|tara:strand:+ start:1038 stop:1316 length:279 start_codon:yes stop_codon:yes gene_type:complete